MSEEPKVTRRRRVRRRTPVAGSAPGTLNIDPNAPRPEIKVLAYGPEAYIEKPILKPEEIRELLERWPVTWIDVHGLGDAKTVRKLGELLHLHQLALEDVVNVGQRPKVESYNGRLFMVLREATYADQLLSEQLSLFLGENFVLTFHETPGDPFEPVRQRIRDGGKRIRPGGPDYLTYAIVDTTVDHYFPILEGIGERLEEIQDIVIERPEKETVAAIYGLKRDLLSLRRTIWPIREALNTLLRDPHSLIKDETRLYLRDCYDHSVQLMDVLENCREIASGLMDIYLSSLSNRMNEVMKVLTIFAAIFIPLTFVAGIYGMNFNPEASPFNMPELNWAWGYPTALGLMAALAGGMLLYFKRKGWF